MGRRKRHISQMFILGLLMLCTVIFFSSCAQGNTPQEHKKNRKTEEHKEKRKKEKRHFTIPNTFLLLMKRANLNSAHEKVS